LSLRERQNTWQENCPCTCADYVYYLEHSCQHHLVMANVRAAPHKYHRKAEASDIQLRCPYPSLSESSGVHHAFRPSNQPSPT
jgi:transcriptional antiterminator Rof (Rho-off)